MSGQIDTLKKGKTKENLDPTIKSNKPVFSSKVSATADTLEEDNDEDLLYGRLAKNAFFGEVFTNGGFYSLNYDRVLIRKRNWAMTARSGFFFWPKAHNILQGALIVEPNVLIGKEKFFFETGLGFTRFHIYERTGYKKDKGYKQTDSENYISARIGFRVQNKKKEGLFFRAGLTPFIYYMDSAGSDWYFQLLGGVGFGVSF